MVSHTHSLGRCHTAHQESPAPTGSERTPERVTAAASSPVRASPGRKLNLFRHLFSSIAGGGNVSGNTKKQQQQQRSNCCLSLISRSSLAVSTTNTLVADNQQTSCPLSSRQVQRRASSGNQVNHLVRMILDKNTSSNQQQVEQTLCSSSTGTSQRRHSSVSQHSIGISTSDDAAGQMLILLGSARCPQVQQVRQEQQVQVQAEQLAPHASPPEAVASSCQQMKLSNAKPPPTLASQQHQQQQVNPVKPTKRPPGNRLVGALMARSLERQQPQQQVEQQPARLEQLISLLDRLSSRCSPEPSVMANLPTTSATNQSHPAPSATSHQQQQTDTFTCRDNPLYLEQSWTELLQVEAIQKATSNLRGQQDAIWELLSTEAFYIQRIRVLVELFLATLLELQRHSLLLEVDPRCVLSNVDEVYATNCAFWNNHLLPMLEEARTSRLPLEPTLMRNAFVQLRSLFRAYYRYCCDYSTCLRAIKELSASNELFRVYMAWCESQKDCERLRLADLMAKPMQRLTKYPLLLKAIQKRCEQPDQLAALTEMVGHTSRFVLSVDLELRRRDDVRSLAQSERRIESYEIGTDVYSDEVERLVKEHYTNFQLTAPLFGCRLACQRQLLLDSSQPNRVLPDSHCSLGQVKFKDGQVSGKLDVVLLLFTDHLFVCKQIGPANSSSNNSHNNNNNNNSFKNNQQQHFRHSSSIGGHAHSALAGSLSPAHSARNHTSATLLRPPQSGGGGGTGSALFQLYPRHAPSRHRAGSNSSASSAASTAMGVSGAMATTSARPNSLSPRASSLTLTPLVCGATHSASSQDVSGYCGTTLDEPSAASVGHRHASAQSLAARDYFRRSAEAVSNSNSAEHLLHLSSDFPADSTIPQCRADTDEATPSRLRVIRSPYPIERLVLHELKGGSSVFCCQLNDSRTIASSFVLYLQTGSGESSASAAASADCSNNNNTGTGEFGLSGANSSEQSRRRWSDARWRSPGSGGHSNLSPARQLIQLIRQAQVRYQVAANFHQAHLSDLALQVNAEREAREPSSSSAEGKMPATNETRQVQQPQRHRLSSWSSFRQSRREKRTRETANTLVDSTNPTQSNEQPVASSSDAQTAEEPAPVKKSSASYLSGALAKAALEQQQQMLLNHNLYEQLVIATTVAPKVGDLTCTITTTSSTSPLNPLQATAAQVSGSQSSVFEPADPMRYAASLPAQVRPLYLSPNVVLSQQQQQQPEAAVSGAGSGRRHFSRSTRVVATNLELSLDATVGQEMSSAPGNSSYAAVEAATINASPQSSSSSTSTHSSSLHFSNTTEVVKSSVAPLPPITGKGATCANSDCVWRRRSWHQVSAAANQQQQQVKVTKLPVVEPQTSCANCANSSESNARATPTASPRRNLSSLRRQNVILSVSGEHQPQTAACNEQMVRRAHELSYATKLRALCLAQVQPDSQSTTTDTNNSTTTTTTTSGFSLSTTNTNNNNQVRATTTNSSGQVLTGSSQATTVDQMSVTFDDMSNAVNVLPERIISIREQQLEQQLLLQQQNGSSRATASFELGNLRRTAQVQSGDDLAKSGGVNARSASMETGKGSVGSGRRACVSVTVTLPNSENATQVANFRRDSFTELSSSYLDIPGQPRNRCMMPNDDDGAEEEVEEEELSALGWMQLQDSSFTSTEEASSLSLQQQQQRQRLALNLALSATVEDQPTVGVPVLNITNASPQNYNSSCEFPVTCYSANHLNEQQQSCDPSQRSRSSELITSRFSSPDWSLIGADEPVRRAASANALGSDTSSPPPGELASTITATRSGDESVHFLKRCQNYLRSHRPNRRRNLNKMNLIKSAKIDLERSSHSQDSMSNSRAHSLQRQVSPQTARLRLALSEAAASEQQQSSTECDETAQQLLDINCLSNLVHPQPEQVSTNTAYLGFHEKLQLHNKMQLEEEKRREQRRKLTRSATGEIFDSLLRAKSKVGGTNSRRSGAINETTRPQPPDVT